MEVPELNFDTREDLDWVAWFQSMASKNKTSSPGFIARAIFEAKKKKEAAEAEKLQNEQATAKEISTTAKTSDKAKAKKVKQKQRAIPVEKESSKRQRVAANKDNTGCDMGNDNPKSTRPAKKTDTRRSPRKTTTVTICPHNY